MKQAPFSLDDLNDRSVSVKLPADLVGMLEKESKQGRKTVLTQWREVLQDRADAKEAARRWKDIESGRVKPIPAEEVYKRLGI